jgi:hypothetical protein
VIKPAEYKVTDIAEVLNAQQQIEVNAYQVSTTFQIPSL